MRKITIVLSALVVTAALALTGCSSKQGDQGNANIRPNSINKRFADDGSNEMNRIRGTQQMNNNVVGIHDNTHLQSDQKLAKRLASRPDILSTYVMRTDHNAYVSVFTERSKRGEELTDRVKNQIADKVKSLSPGIDNVYVSANAELRERFKMYDEQVSQGHPIQGLLTEFNSLVNRIFPESSGFRSQHAPMATHQH